MGSPDRRIIAHQPEQHEYAYVNVECWFRATEKTQHGGVAVQIPVIQDTGGSTGRAIDGHGSRDPHRHPEKPLKRNILGILVIISDIVLGDSVFS